MEVKVKFNDINVKEEKEKTLVKILMLKGEKGEKGDGDFNVIEDVKVNGTSLPVSDKSVNVEIPTNNSAFNNDSGYLVENDMQMTKTSDVQNGSQITDGTGYGRLNKIYGDTSQIGTPTPDNPIDIEVVTGDVEISISNSDNTSSQDFTLSLGDIELCKIGDNQDYIFNDNGKWYIYNVIKKMNLNGTESWRSATSQRPAFLLDNLTDKLSGNNNFYCDKLKYLGNAQSQDLGYAMSFNTGQYSRYLYIQVPSSVVNTGDTNTFKQWLSDNTMNLYYPIINPSLIEITDNNLIEQLNAIKNFSLYSEETNITISSDNLLPKLNITYSITERDIYSKEETNDLIEESEKGLNETISQLDKFINESIFIDNILLLRNISGQSSSQNSCKNK